MEPMPADTAATAPPAKPTARNSLFKVTPTDWQLIAAKVHLSIWKVPWFLLAFELSSGQGSCSVKPLCDLRDLSAMLSPMRLSRATLHPDDRGDRCGARPALVLSSAGNENGGIICDGSNHGSERCSGVSLVVNVGVRQHRGSPAPNTSVGTGIRLGEDATDPFGLISGGGSGELQSGIG
jgi:hypothetical protein